MQAYTRRHTLTLMHIHIFKSFDSSGAGMTKNKAVF